MLNSEPAGKLFLSHAELRSNSPHVNKGRYMDPVIAFLSLAARIGDGFLQTATDAASHLARLFFLP